MLLLRSDSPLSSLYGPPSLSLSLSLPPPKSRGRSEWRWWSLMVGFGDKGRRWFATEKCDEWLRVAGSVLSKFVMVVRSHLGWWWTRTATGYPGWRRPYGIVSEPECRQTLERFGAPGFGEAAVVVVCVDEGDVEAVHWSLLVLIRLFIKFFFFLSWIWIVSCHLIHNVNPRFMWLMEKNVASII